MHGQTSPDSFPVLERSRVTARPRVLRKTDMLGHMGTYQYRFMDPGANEYHCDPHPYMTGTVAVTA